jgi:hypothetical protein
MDYRGVLLIGMLCGGALVGATSACSGEDPGQITFRERPRGATGDLTSGGTTSGQVTDGGGTTEGGGADATTEAGPTGDPVFGATTFTLGALGRNGSGQPAKSANAQHMGDASGKDCMSCHAGTWAFAGTLYTDKASTTPVKDAEIRISKPDGTLYASTYSDADGNFWIDALQAAIPTGSRVGVRSATIKPINMVGAVGAGQAGCSQAGTCHGGTQGKVYLK